jgi:hypothetical protein
MYRARAGTRTQRKTHGRIEKCLLYTKVSCELTFETFRNVLTFREFRGPVLKTRGNKKHEASLVDTRDTACCLSRGNRRSTVALFQKVVALNPPGSLLPWTKVSKLPTKTLNTSIKTLGGAGWAHLFPALTPRSTEDNLLIASKTLRDAIQEYHRNDNRVHG